MKPRDISLRLRIVDCTERNVQNEPCLTLTYLIHATRMYIPTYSENKNPSLRVFNGNFIRFVAVIFAQRCTFAVYTRSNNNTIIFYAVNGRPCVPECFPPHQHLSSYVYGRGYMCRRGYGARLSAPTITHCLRQPVGDPLSQSVLAVDSHGRAFVISAFLFLGHGITEGRVNKPSG